MLALGMLGLIACGLLLLNNQLGVDAEPLRANPSAADATHRSARHHIARRSPMDPWTRSFMMLKQSQLAGTKDPATTSASATASASTSDNDTANFADRRKRRKHRPTVRANAMASAQSAQNVGDDGGSGGDGDENDPDDDDDVDDELHSKRHTIDRLIGGRDSGTRLVIRQRVTCTPCKIVPHHRHRPANPSSSSSSSAATSAHRPRPRGRSTRTVLNGAADRRVRFGFRFV